MRRRKLDAGAIRGTVATTVTTIICPRGISKPPPAWGLKPVDTGIAVRSVELPDLHPDPADRLIVASAERLGATLVTKDERLRAYPGLATVWG
jgi:hypothetical protein